MDPSKLKETFAAIIRFSQPTFLNGRWRKPKLSRRKLGVLKKTFILAGVGWPELPSKYKPPATYIREEKGPKGHKYEKEKELRKKKIAENLVKIDKQIETMKKEREIEKRKKVTPFDWFLMKEEEKRKIVQEATEMWEKESKGKGKKK